MWQDYFLFAECLYYTKNSEDLNISFIESFEKSIKEAESDIANKTERLAAVNEKLSLISCERDEMLNSANAAVNADGFPRRPFLRIFCGENLLV